MKFLHVQHSQAVDSGTRRAGTAVRTLNQCFKVTELLYRRIYQNGTRATDSFT